MASCCCGCWPKPKLRTATDAEAAAVAALVARANTPFSPDTEPSHLALLERLWATFHDNVSGVKRPFERTSPEWLKIGFQNVDPVSDVRGGGALAIDNMLAFIEASPTAAIAMAEDREASKDLATAAYMPWATAGINVTRLLLDMFGVLGPDGSAVRNATSKKLRCWPLILNFDGLYALAFKMLDSTFEEKHGTYFSFPHVKATVCGRLDRVAKRSGASSVRCESITGRLPTQVPELEARLRKKRWVRSRSSRRLEPLGRRIFAEVLRSHPASGPPLSVPASEYSRSTLGRSW